VDLPRTARGIENLPSRLVAAEQDVPVRKRHRVIEAGSFGKRGIRDDATTLAPKKTRPKSFSTGSSSGETRAVGAQEQVC